MMYRAYITRASSGDADNTPIIERTLALRREQARLLGFDNYAEVSMASKVGATLSRTPPSTAVAWPETCKLCDLPGGPSIFAHFFKHVRQHHLFRGS